MPDGDKPDKVLDTLRDVIRLSREVGLELNPGKCELAIFGASPSEEQAILEQFRTVVPGVIHLDSAATMLLGGPLTDSALERILQEKTTRFQIASARLNLLSSHSAFYLLRASTAMPRLLYFLRCAPAFKKRAQLEAYDAALKLTLETILNCSLSSEAWLQSSLPVRFGGLGVRQAVDTAIPCYLASCHSVTAGVTALLPTGMELLDADVEDAMDQWSGMVMPLERPAEALRRRQDVWEQPLFALSASQLRLAATTMEDKARLLATVQPEVGAWLDALPSPQLGTHLSDECFRISTALRLGCEICQPHKCPCGVFVGSRGLHGLSCRRSAGRHSRHATCNDVISRALRTAEVPNVREPAGCSRGDGERPDGQTLLPWSRGRALVWDYTCADTFAPSHLPTSSAAGGRVAADAAAWKRAKYQYLAQRFIFMPVAMETSGAWDLEGLRFIREVGTRVVAVTGEPRATSYLLQRLSLAVQRGNVAAVLGTLPAGSELDEIFLF